MTVSLDIAHKGAMIYSDGFDLSPTWLREYIDAVEDAVITSVAGAVPPLAVGTQAIGALLKGTTLPPGAIHASQQLSWPRLFGENEGFGSGGYIDGRAERQGWVLMTIQHEVTDDEGEIAMGGKASIVFPTKKAAVQSAVGATNQLDSEITPQDSPEALAYIDKFLTQEKINRYAEVSGDRNPLHIDPAFAATTQFGGTIAHGMLILAYISEMMTAAFGGRWLASGRLKVRFRGAARPGDTVTASGRVVGLEEGRTSCEVECRNQAGELLIAGEAEVRT